ncbi:hypothetical protein CYMTET_41808 [Cymbomonas tetramitiformis]|uniref:Uncharacterized protein n=1 Tax=Cymbomonas tetramitiformis TaxID=36881 RepID=A0AAE0F296_9CHLO|nr:hypothetical protein CYMTET_41808 [Cymbomonas tetramitiformis]
MQRGEEAHGAGLAAGGEEAIAAAGGEAHGPALCGGERGGDRAREGRVCTGSGYLCRARGGDHARREGRRTGAGCARAGETIAAREGEGHARVRLTNEG